MTKQKLIAVLAVAAVTAKKVSSLTTVINHYNNLGYECLSLEARLSMSVMCVDFF